MSIYNKFFYNELIRKYVIAFGSLFTDIHVIRRNGQDEEIQRQFVPLTYSPKERFIARLEQDSQEQQRVAIKLPRMGFEILSYDFDPERKLSSKRTISKDGKFIYNPVPYDFEFALNIFTKTQEEGLQIVEQIIPFFTPEYTITMNLVPEVGFTQDIPIELTSVTKDDNYEGSFDDRRSIIWTLTFRLKGYLAGPCRSRGVIQTSEINFRINGECVPASDPETTLSGAGIISTFDGDEYFGSAIYPENSVVYDARIDEIITISVENVSIDEELVDLNDYRTFLVYREYTDNILIESNDFSIISPTLVELDISFSDPSVYVYDVFVENLSTGEVTKIETGYINIRK